MKDEKRADLLIFGDGACAGNPGPGGWGAIVIDLKKKTVCELGGAHDLTTNNQMELTAIGKALRQLQDTPGSLEVLTDSTYVIQGITQWIWGWMKNGWKTSEQNEVANAVFWQRLFELTSAREKKFGKIKWGYVRGHVGIAGNERCDEIAVCFSKAQFVDLYTGSIEGYPLSEKIFDLPDDRTLPVRSTTGAGFGSKEKKVAYSYLSLVQSTAKRHSSWKECEARIKGVSGAKFKKCADAEEEKAVLSKWGVVLSK